MKIAVYEGSNQSTAGSVLKKANSGLTLSDLQTEEEFYKAISASKPSDLFLVDGMALKEMMTSKERNGERVFLVPMAGVNVIVQVSSVICIEHYRRRVTFYMEDSKPLQTKYIREDFATFVAPFLEDERFIRARKFLVVNMDKVEQISNRFFMLKNGMRYVIPRATDARIKKIIKDRAVSSAR